MSRPVFIIPDGTSFQTEDFKRAIVKMKVRGRLVKRKKHKAYERDFSVLLAVEPIHKGVFIDTLEGIYLTRPEIKFLTHETKTLEEINYLFKKQRSKGKKKIEVFCDSRFYRNELAGINRTSDPTKSNCSLRLVVVDGKQMFGLFAKRDIEREEELSLFQKKCTSPESIPILLSTHDILSYMFKELLGGEGGNKDPAINIHSSVANLEIESENEFSSADELTDGENVSYSSRAETQNTPEEQQDNEFENKLSYLQDIKKTLHKNSDFITSSQNKDFFIQKWKAQGFKEAGIYLRINFGIFRSNFPEKKEIFANLCAQTHLVALSILNCDVFDAKDIVNISNLKSLQTLELSSSSFGIHAAVAIAKLTALKELRIKYCPKFEPGIPYLTSLTSLLSVELQCNLKNESFISPFLQSQTNLTALYLPGAECVATSLLNQLLRLPNLRKIDFSYCSGKLNDQEIAQFITQHPALVKINLSNCSAVGTLTIQAIKKLKNIKTIDIDKCTNVTAHHTQELIDLRKRGCKVIAFFENY